MKNILILQSGGTTQVLNSSLAGVIKGANEKGVKVYSIKHGLTDIANFKLTKNRLLVLNNLNLFELKNTPGSAITGTSRIKKLEEEEFKKLEEIFEHYEIDTIINCGGSGTIKQTKSIYNYFKGKINVVALPKTVDNDFGDSNFENLFFTPGYPSIANFWKQKVEMLNNESLGALSHDKVLVAQTFGRETGLITATAALGDIKGKIPLMLLLPEDQRPKEEILEYVNKMIKNRGRCIIVMSEGYKINNFKELKDLSGQTMYGSSTSTNSQELVNYLNENNIQSRLYNPTIEQRQDVSCVPEFDREIAFNQGYQSTKFIERYDNFFVTVNNRFEIGYIPLDEIPEKWDRKLKEEWIDFGNFDVTDDFIEYLFKIFEYKN
jgi:6-phosphofructokinase